MEVNPNEKLDEILELTKENNRMIRALRGAQKRAAAFRLLYWLVIIGLLAFGAFYYVQPYLEQIMGVYAGAQSSIDAIQNATSSVQNGDWKSILDSYKQ